MGPRECAFVSSRGVHKQGEGEVCGEGESESQQRGIVVNCCQ